MKKTYKMVGLSNAAMSSGMNYKSDILKILGTGYFMTYYFFSSKNAKLQLKGP